MPQRTHGSLACLLLLLPARLQETGYRSCCIKSAPLSPAPLAASVRSMLRGCGSSEMARQLLTLGGTSGSASVSGGRLHEPILAMLCRKRRGSRQDCISASEGEHEGVRVRERASDGIERHSHVCYCARSIDAFLNPFLSFSPSFCLSQCQSSSSCVSQVTLL